MDVNKGAYPGCQSVGSKDVKIFTTSNLDIQTYEVESSDSHQLTLIWWSLAGIKYQLIGGSKVDLVSKDKGLSLDDKLRKTLGKLVKKSDYADLKLREILAHQGQV